MWIWSFVVGCCIGSFLNVVALRLQKEENFIRGHSHCVECLHELSWKDLIPVLSWMWLRGKCRYCGRKNFISLLDGRSCIRIDVHTYDRNLEWKRMDGSDGSVVIDQSPSNLL